MAENRAFNLLVVDDDPLIHSTLKLIIPKEWKVFSIQNIDLLHLDRFYHVAFVDMHLRPKQVLTAENADGPTVIQRLLAHHPQMEIVAMSGDLNRDLMEKCIRVGAQRFLPKPLEAEEVLMVIEKLEAWWRLVSMPKNLSHQTVWIGSSYESQNLQKQISQLRGEEGSALIEGETGTGKEVVAHLLHEQEPQRPFVAVNMAALPENIFESEMFGHVKGSFTGADQNKVGLIEAANGGDLFLDEIEALPLSQQAKLLRFLESKEIRKVGSKESIQIRVRVISASNKPLQEMVAKGEFREDLYFRLCSHKIQLPPLRQRLGDIEELARYFLENVRPKRSKQFSDDGYNALKKHNWPGNIRELKRVCEQLSLTSPLPLIREEDVFKILRPSSENAVNLQSQNRASASEKSEKIRNLSVGLHQLLNEFEAELIRECINEHKDIEKAAQLLKISRSSLYKKIKDHNIEIDERE